MGVHGNTPAVSTKRHHSFGLLLFVNFFMSPETEVSPMPVTAVLRISEELKKNIISINEIVLCVLSILRLRRGYSIFECRDVIKLLRGILLPFTAKNAR